MVALLNDLKYGIRMLRKRIGFTVVAVTTLAIGIGANTVMFGIVNSLMLRPVNVKQPEQLVLCESTGRVLSGVPFSLFDEIRRNNRVFSDIACFSRRGCVFRLGNVSKHVEKMFVSSNYFSMLGATDMRGRGFLPQEERWDAGCVGVLSYDAWLRLGGDASVVGKMAFVDGYPCRIVGIAPKGFTGATLVSPSIWLPLGAYSSMRPVSKTIEVDFMYPWNLRPLGRLRPGLSREAADASLTVLSAHLRKTFPSDWKSINQLRLRPLPRIHVSIRNEHTALAVISTSLMIAGIVVLCIACLNLAHMVLVQGAARQREIAIRRALGAGRFRVIRQFLTESLLLALLGGAVGLVFAYGCTRLLNAVIARPKYFHGVQIGLDLAVLAATLGFSLLATVLSGLSPALRLSKYNLVATMKASCTGFSQAPAHRNRIIPRGVSVAGQVALAALLVMGAALFTRSAWQAAHVDPGYGTAGKLIMGIDCRVDGRQGAPCRQLYAQLMARLRGLPGIQAVGLSEELPLDGLASADVQMAEPQTNDKGRSRRASIESAKQNIAGDYFQAMGLSLLQGRYFTREEGVSQAKVAIVNETLARQLKPDGNVLGYRFKWGGEIVGIAPAVRHSLFREQPEPQVYYPLRESPGQAFLVVRVVDGMIGHEGALLGRLRREIHGTSPDIPIFYMGTMSEFHHTRLGRWSANLMAQLSLVFGAVALFLAALGIYGVKGYMVATRTPEFGIRMALGARGRDIVSMVLRDRVMLTLSGLGAGVCIAVGVAHAIGRLFLANVLCDLNPVDPVSVVVTLVLVGFAILIAGYIPAQRAAKIDPMEALRRE